MTTPHDGFPAAFPGHTYVPGPAPTVPQPIVSPTPSPTTPWPAAGGRRYRIPQVPASAWTAAASRRRAWVSRCLLLGILVIQAVLSLRLHNTAFEDEALYLVAGHLNLDHLLHGGPAHPEFARYFSGSPMVYPPLAAAVDGVFGLAGARLIGFACMILCTGLLYSTSRLLFNERVGLAAAGAFAIAQSTVFLGNFATYDPPAILLLALSAWLLVRCAHERAWAAYLFAPPLLVLAVATKYAALMYVPVVVVLGFLVTFRQRRVDAFLRLLVIPSVTGVLLAAAVLRAGPSYLTALSHTTTQRATGSDSVGSLLTHSAEWGGAVFALALLGTLLYARHARMGEVAAGYDSRGPGWRWRLLLGALLTSAALLAPAYQIHLHTGVSLHKHIGYGLWFAAPMAGVGLTRLVGAHFRNPQVGILIWVTLLVLGMSQSQTRYEIWPNSRPVVATLRSQLQPNGRYLAESNWVTLYYLRTRTRIDQWTSTYTIDYTDHTGRRLTGEPAYRAAIAAGYFDVVELDGTDTPALDRTLTADLRGNPRYRLLARLPYDAHGAKGTYDVWVKNPAAAKAHHTAKRRPRPGRRSPAVPPPTG
jgi:Dolichyl-phosphate-mannose-protein mannosyltransferase